MARIYLKDINKALAKHDVKMFRDPHGYYYFIRISEKEACTWQENIEPWYEYNLEDTTIQRIVDHVLRFRI